MILRPLCTEDAPLLAALHREINHPWEKAWSTQSYKELLIQPSILGWKATCERDDMLAFILLQHSGEEGEILFLMVGEKHKRTGMGTALLSIGEQELTQRGALSIFLDVCDLNQSAIDFYTHHAYLCVFLRKKYYNLGHISFDAHILRKNL